MASTRPSRRTDPDAPAPDVSVQPPPTLVGRSEEFITAVYTQLAHVQTELGKVLTKLDSANDRIKSLESKVGTLNRLLWIGTGIVVGIAALAGIAQPLIRFLIHTGIVSVG